MEQGVTSNSVLYVKDECTVGIGTGEQDRVGVAEIAVYKAYQKYSDTLCFDRYHPVQGPRTGHRKRHTADGTKDSHRCGNPAACGGLKGAAMVSDAFFPFRDGVDVGIRQGITAVVQPGGSMRDWEVIEAAMQPM